MSVPTERERAKFLFQLLPRISSEYPLEWLRRVKCLWRNRNQINETSVAFHVMTCTICGNIHPGDDGDCQ